MWSPKPWPALSFGLLSVLVLFSSCLVVVPCNAQQGQQQTSLFTPLSVYVHTPSAAQDYERACYPSLTGEKVFVKFGSPEGCGKGCQHIASVSSASSDFSSEYLYEGRSTLANLVGKPSDTPSDTLGKALAHSWTSLQPNAGNEFFTFQVAQKTFVTKLDIYQGFNPGAVSKVEAFDTEQVRWVEIWNKADHGAESSRESADETSNGVVLTVLAQFRLKFVLAKEFKIHLDTASVVGYNTIDAVKVYGLEENGKPLGEYTPACDAVTQSDCFYECKSFDMIHEQSSVANFHAVGSAVSWVESALKVRHVDVVDPEADPSAASSNEVLVSYSALEEASQMCRNVPYTKAIRGMSQHEGDVALVVTQRPSFGAPIEVKSCARYAAPAVSRPAVIHLNVVPGYSSSAGITKASLLDHRKHFEAKQAHLHVVDSMVHYLYRGLGWDLEFRADFVGHGSNNVTTVVQQQGTSWSNRYRVYLNLSKMKQRAEAHFGASNMEGVELEDDGLLLSSRVYNGEVMTLPPYVRDATFQFSSGWTFAHEQGTDQHEGLRAMTRSAISLAYFEETGWYQPDYFSAQHLAWGHLAGNDFVKQNCKTWGMGSTSTSRYLCKRSFEPTLYTKTALEAVTYPTAQEKQCSFDRLYKGMCVTKLWGSDIPTHSEYWDVQSGMGGMSEQLGYCPVVVPDPSLSYFNSNFLVNCQDTTGKSKSDPTTRFFEEFGESSRCFEANTLGDSTVFTACLTHKCLRTGQLQIKVRDEVEECPTGGGKVTFQQSGIAVDCTGYQHLCATYEHLTKPTLSVVSPLDNVVLTTRELSAQLLLDNYQADRHYLKLYVNDRLYKTVTSFGQVSPDESLLTTISLGALPVTVRSAQNSITIRYELAELVDGSEKVHSLVEHSHVVRNTMEQWAKPVNASSEHPDFGFAQGIAQAEDTKGWSPKQISFEDGPSGHHQVVVSLEKEVQVSQVLVYYNFGYASQQLKSISVENVDEKGAFVMVWRSNETEPTSSSLDSETVTFSPAPFFSQLVKLEFDGAQWLEVDAIKCVGFLTVLPAFRPSSTGLSSSGVLSIDLPTGGHQDAEDKRLFSFEVPFESVHARDSATLFWEAKINVSDWIHVKQGQGTGTASSTVSATLAHRVTLLVDVTKAPTTETAVNLTILDSYETDPLTPPLTSLLLKITNQVDTHNKPPCYDGLLVEENMAFSCKCSPGAHGSACELHACPRNCSGSGVCDSFEGTCKCANGFYGLDCSGKFPKCYVSKDGSCENGFTLGTYVIDSGLPNSVNYAEGNTPHSLLCDGSSKPTNEFSCSSLSTVEFCCQNKELPSCPFLEGSAPCRVPNCPYISADSFAHLGNKIISANTSTISECTQAVLQHCYSNAHDPGCAGLRKTEVPSKECPLSVLIDECKKKEGTDACKDLFPKIASFSTCSFKDTQDVLNPCNVPNCRENPYALGECRGYVESHCRKYPEDRECELHGLGDGCFFLPGSQPCTSVDCLQSGWGTDACKNVIKSYCSYGSQDDPECLVHGYSNNILSETLATFTCPWEKITASCHATNSPDSACKLLLREKLELPTSQGSSSSVQLSSATVEASLLELHAAAMKTHRDSNAVAGLVSMLMNKISMSQSGNLNTKELAALLSLFPMEAILGQHFVHYSWSEELSDALYPILSSSGFASEKEIQAEIETYLGDNIVV